MSKSGSHWRIALFRPGNDPIANMAHALNAAEIFSPERMHAQIEQRFTETTLRRGQTGLIEAVQEARMPMHEKALIVIDQFEELFRFKQAAATIEGENEAAAFVKLFLAATKQQEPPIYVIITMRSDYLGDCAQFRDLPEAINDGQYLIPRMTRDQRRQAIAGPVAVGGATNHAAPHQSPAQRRRRQSRSIADSPARAYAHVGLLGAASSRQRADRSAALRCHRRHGARIILARR
jgi:hypothetical protein